jgi:hypothetical protein
MHVVHNARVQLAATAFNNLGVGAIVAAVRSARDAVLIGGMARCGCTLPLACLHLA